MAKAKRDLSDMFGDPTIDEGDEEPTYHRQSDNQEAEAALLDGIARLDKRAADMGIEDKEWWLQDDPQASEYHEFRKGLPVEYARDEYDRGKRKFENTSRQELDGMKQGWAITSAFADELYSDYLDTYGNDAGPEEVAAAAERVAERYRIDGSRNVARKISKNRDAFLDDVSTEILMGGGSGGGDGTPSKGRTGGIGGIGGGGGRSMKEQEADGPGSMWAELTERQKKEGYYG